MDLSVLFIPCSTLKYTMGNTIRNEINTDRLEASSHMRQIMIKDATGTVFATVINGQSMVSIR